MKFETTKDYGWRCQLMDKVLWQSPEGKAPKWFHRKMQELVFGVKWYNIGVKKD